MSITVKKAYKPHAKDSGKEVHIGDGEKGVAHSYLGVDLSKHSYTLGQIPWLNIHQQDFCESYFSLEIIVYWLVTQSKVTYFPTFVYSPFRSAIHTAFHKGPKLR